MFALQITAAILLVFSALCFFGPQLVIYGPRVIPVMLKQRQTRFIGGFLATACAFAVTAPYFGTAMMTGGEIIADTTMDIVTMTFAIV
jgi:hypothetical protein